MNLLQTHALSLRRAVPGRRKPFDELLAEHKARVNCEKEQQQNQALKLQEQAAQKSLDATLKRTTSTSEASVTSSESSRLVNVYLCILMICCCATAAAQTHQFINFVKFQLK